LLLLLLLLPLHGCCCSCQGALPADQLLLLEHLLEQLLELLLLPPVRYLDGLLYGCHAADPLG
jgi:hypothetical protein